MPRSLPLLLSGILSLYCAPALAADPGQIACPVEALDGGDRERLADHVRRQANWDKPAMQVFFRSNDGCTAHHRWSLEAARQAVIHNLAMIGQREARLGLERLGIDVAPIERALLADRAVVESARTEQAADVIGAFYERLDPAIRRRAEATGDAGANLLGTYLLFRAAVETSRADFTAG